jgi:uncharacterized protein (DUF1015 family)
MAVIAPFRAVRYNAAKVGRMEDVVTPPYDVIDDRAQAAFLAKNPYNMIQLDLSKKTSRESRSDERYQKAKALFEEWQQEGIMLRDGRPALYLYFVEYTHPSGRRLTRKGLVSLVQLAEFSEGIVKPHEMTFAGVTSDRLRLMDTCKAHFSQIFSLYSDKTNEIMKTLETSRGSDPLVSVIDQDGCRHTLWSVEDPAAINSAQTYFKGKSLYIADGHHRYTTALQLRELARQRGEVTEDSPFNFTVMYLCPMEDEGLSVLPTHRLVRLPTDAGDTGVDAICRKLSECFDVEQVGGGSREVLLSEVLSRIDEFNSTPSEKRSAASLFGLYHSGEDRCLLLMLRPGCMEKHVGHQPEALRQLDVVVLSDLILEDLLQLSHERCEQEDLIEYFSDPDDALDVAVKESNSEESRVPLLFLMNNTTVEQVKRVADEGLIMPHKSTYFYPKILTGLLINKIVPEEKVLLPR